MTKPLSEPLPPVGEALSDTEPVAVAVGLAVPAPVELALSLSLLLPFPSPVEDAAERETLAVLVEETPSSLSSSQVSSVGLADLVADAPAVPDPEVTVLVTEAAEAAEAEPAPDPEAAAD